MRHETIHWHPTEYHVLRLPAGHPPPAAGGTFLAVLHEPDQTTVVGTETQLHGLPAGDRSGPWRLLCLEGPLPHDAVGILARLSNVLAGRSIPIFALSTFDTDYVLVPADRVTDADDALREAGYTIPTKP